MRTTRHLVGHPLGALLVFVSWAGAARGEYIASGAGLEGLGSFSGTLDYHAAGPGSATLTVSLYNTSPAANGGYLTAFAFHNPSGRITGASLTATNPNFGLLGNAGSPWGISAPPFGQFDLGASTTGAFLGGGSPKGGIGVGQSAIFIFALSGKGLDQLSAGDFLGAPPPGAGAHWADFLARFRGFMKGSDKVPGVKVVNTPPGGGVVHLPEPGALPLVGIAAGLLSGWWARWGRRRGGSAGGSECSGYSTDARPPFSNPG